MSDFHNPYNFVPFLPRERVRGELGDGPPAAFGVYHDDRIWGTLTCTVTARSPLLVPAPKPRSDGEKHRVIDVRRDAEGRPFVPGSAVKGVLRAAHEMVTGSRLLSTRGWDEPLARRVEAASAQGLVPVRVVWTDGRLVAQVLAGTVGRCPTSGDVKRGGLQPAAWLPAYRTGHDPLLDLPDGLRDRRAAISKLDGQPVAFVATLFEHHRRRFNRQTRREEGFRLWGVTEVSAADGAPIPVVAAPNLELGTYGRYKHLEGPRRFAGYLSLTGLNANNKRYERVFFCSSSEPVELEVDAEVAASWRAVMRAYSEQHTASELREAPGGRNPVAPDWSRHLTDRASARLPEDEGEALLCYAIVDGRNGSPDSADGKSIRSLQPVSISRQPHAKRPIDLTPKDLQPAASIEQCSPTDRMFGWVASDTASGADARRAVRARVRVQPLDFQKAAVERPGGDGGIPLEILSTPKYANARFYFLHDGAPVAPARRSDLDVGARPSARWSLRGRKAYPPHGPAWERAFAEVATDATADWRRPGAERSDQNASVREWIKPGSTAELRVDLDGVTEADLGALLTVLELASDSDRLHPSDSGRSGRLRIGLGRPLGFGSLEVAWQSVTVSGRRGDAARQAYLDGKVPVDRTLDAGEIAAAVEGFRRSWCTAFDPDGDPQAAWEDRGAVVPLLRAFGGHGDGLPTHYPRRERRASLDLPSYEWFVENERGRRMALPLLDGDIVALPYLPQGDR